MAGSRVAGAFGDCLQRAKFRKPLTLLIVVEKERVLLGMKNRGFGKGKYNGFGGKVEKDEEIAAAALRELEEEAGIRAKDATKAGILLFEFEGNDEVLEVHLFRCESFEGEVTASEEMTPEWFPKDKIPLDNMWPDDSYWMDRFLEGETFCGYFLFRDESTIISHELTNVSELPTLPKATRKKKSMLDKK